jgi:ferredoxin
MSSKVSKHQIKLLKDGEWHPFYCRSDENIWIALGRAGLKNIPGGCGGGGCGICKVQILSGEVHKRRMSATHITEKDLEQNIVLACCVMPLSDIELVYCER